MAIPSNRYKILPLRGLKVNLDAGLADIMEGEMCYATDEDRYYQKENGALVAVGGASEFSGDYNDLINKPSIPTATSDLTNDSGFITAAEAPVQPEDLFSGDYDDLANKPEIPSTTSALVNDSGFITAAEAPVQPEDLNSKADLVNGVVPNSQLPSIAITEYLGEVADETAMLALVGQKGDWCIRTDTSSSWVVTGEDSSQLDSWAELATPVSAVTSVNGYTGTVILGPVDVGALASGDNISELTNDAGYITAAEAPVQPGDDVSGNAASATKLETPRTLWGQSFDGTANVSGAIVGATNITGTNANMTIQPAASTTSRSLYLHGNEDTDGAGGSLVLGHATRGSTFFRTGDKFRFAKQGQTSIEGFFNFDNLTADRTYTFPNNSGTIALTSSKTDTSGTADQANKVDVNASTGSADYPILFHNISVGTSGYSSIYYSNSTSDNGQKITMNPRNGKITATTFSGTATTATNCSRTISGGDGLTGGGALTANRTLNVGAGTGISVGNDAVSVDSTVVRTTGNKTLSGNITFSGTTTTNGVLNIRGNADLADNDILRFGSGDDCELFCNGSHMYMDLNSGIGNFYIRDGTTTRFTFNDNGNLTCTGSVTASSFSGKASTAGTADKSNEINRKTFSSSNTWKDIACWNATSNSYEDLANATTGYVQLSGNGKLRASGNVLTNGEFQGKLRKSDVQTALAGSAANSVGSYGLLTSNDQSDRAPGYTRSSGGMRWANCGSGSSTNTVSGSWRLMGRTAGTGSDYTDIQASVWLRYA